MKDNTFTLLEEKGLDTELFSTIEDILSSYMIYKADDAIIAILEELGK